MMPADRDLSALAHIVQYCDEISDAIDAHRLTFEKVKADNVYKNALAMDLLQIGELVGVLSDGFKAEHGAMPWRAIKRMRDKAAHHYGKFDVETLWETVTEDIPPLREYSAAILASVGTSPRHSGK